MIRSYVQLIFMSPCVHLQEKQQQEEEELRRQEREAKLFASLGAQGVPSFGAEVHLIIAHGANVMTIEGLVNTTILLLILVYSSSNRQTVYN